MKLSVALAAWRGTDYLDEQLRSLSAQSRLPDELVAVDDASGDATPALLEDFARKAPFAMHVLRNPVNLGYTLNFERALTETKGDLVFLSDQDDMWFADKLQVMEGWAEDAPEAQIFVCDAELTDRRLKPSGHTKSGQIAAAGLPPSAFVMGCCLAIRRPLLDLMLPFPEGVRGHDGWLVELPERLGLVRRYRQVLQYYRQHGANTSDFYVNTPRRIGLTRRLVRALSSIGSRLANEGGVRTERATLAVQLERLDERFHAFAALAGGDSATKTQAWLEKRIAMLDARLDVRARPPLARPARMFRLWRSGQYRASGGPAGAVRDLLAWGAPRRADGEVSEL